MTGTFGGEGALREQRAGGLTSSRTNGGGRSNVLPLPVTLDGALS